MRLRFWGTRGLLPAPGVAFQRHGGATLCTEVESDAGGRLLIDLGTGCIPLGASLAVAAAQGGSKRLAAILASTRVDHIHGMPFFAPALMPGWDLTIMGPSLAGRDLSTILDGSLNPNYSPLYGLENLTPKLDLITLTEGELSWDGIRIVTRELPYGRARSLGFRIEADGAILTIISDVEYGGAPTPAALDLASDADVLVHDSMSMSSMVDVVARRGPSIRTPDVDAALRVAREANVGRLFLYHFDPDAKDAEIEGLVKTLQTTAGSVVVDAARAGEVVEVTPRR